MKLRHILPALALFGLGFMQAGHADTSQADAEQAAAPKMVALKEVAQIIAKQKQVSVLREAEQFAGKRKTPLLVEDKVITGEKARAQIKFIDGTLTTLGADSEMLIEEFSWSKDRPDPKAEFRLIKGVFRTVTGAITKVTRPDYKVHTPVGSIGIRGTDFWGGYLDGDAIDVLFVGGEHEIVVSNEYGTTVLKKPGQGTTIKAGQAPGKAKVWPKDKVARAVKTISMEK